MAYLGTTHETIPLWSQRWVDSAFGRGGRMESVRIGTTKRELHVYCCDKCGRESRVIGKATEDFFCGAADCSALVGIEPAAVSSR